MSLKQYVIEHSDKNGAYYYYDDKLKTYFSDDRLERLFTVILQNFNRSPGKYNIGEKNVTNTRRLIYNIKLTFQNENNQKDLDNYIYQLISKSNNFLKDAVNQDDNTFYSIYNKLNIVDDGNIKTQIRIYYPYLRLTHENHDKISNSLKQHVFRQLKSDKFIVANTIESKIKIDSDSGDYIYGGSKSNYDLVDCFDFVGGNTEKVELKIDHMMFEHLNNMDREVQYYKPILFSSVYAKDVLSTLVEDNSDDDEDEEEEIFKDDTFDKELYENSERKTYDVVARDVVHLIDLIKLERFTRYEDFMDIMDSLAYVENMKQNLFNKYKSASIIGSGCDEDDKKEEEVNFDFGDEDEMHNFKNILMNKLSEALEKKGNNKSIRSITLKKCEEEWENCVADPKLTDKTIGWFAMCDNKERHSAYFSEIRRKALTEAANMRTGGAIARSFKYCFPYEFVSDHEDIWQYSNHRFVKIVNKTIPTKYRKQYRMFIKTVMKEKEAEMEDANEYKILKSNFEKLSNIMDNHGTTMNSVLKSLKELYVIDSFNYIVDTNKYFTGCKNGVLDVRSNMCIMRKGKPEDYIGKSTENKFPDKITDKEKDNYREYMKKVFPHPDTRHYVYKLISSTLEYGNKHKIILQFYGFGNNGKSVFCNLMTKAFGQYTGRGKVSMLTEKRGKSDTADPSLITLMGVRWAFFQEPGDTDRAQVGKMKEMSGNDKIQMRDLFQKGADMKDYLFGFKMAIFTNETIQIDDPQKAIWNRMVNIKCESEFVSDAPESIDDQRKENRYLIDDNFDVNKYINAMLWYAKEYYAVYKKEGLDMPANMKDDLQRYKNECDIYVNFKNNRIERGKNSDKLMVKDAYEIFTDWYDANGYGGRGKAVSIDKFKRHMVNVLNKDTVKNKNYWLGFTVSRDDIVDILDDSDDDDEEEEKNDKE